MRSTNLNAIYNITKCTVRVCERKARSGETRTLTVAMLPHLDRLNSHTTLVALAPSWQPSIPSCKTLLAYAH
jgi:hypothetical protein